MQLSLRHEQALKISYKRYRSATFIGLFLVWGENFESDGGRGEGELQFSKGVWGHALHIFFFNFEPSRSGSEAF